MNMKKALIATVGTGPTVSHGIIHSINTQNPEYVLLIATEESVKTTIDEINKHYDTAKGIQIDIRISKFIDDVEKATLEYESYLNEILAKGYSVEEIVADFTSGTKPMSAALMFASIEKEVKTLSYVSGERGKEGRVISGSERINTLSPNIIYTEKKINLAIHFFNNFQYSTTLAILKGITNPHYKLKNKIDILTNLSLAFFSWDIFNFKLASETLNELSKQNDITELVSTKELGIFKQVLYKLKEAERPIEEMLLDLIENSKRRYEEGKYDDCIARLYRAIEMKAQIEFFKEFNLSTSKVSVQVLPENSKIYLENKYPNKKELELSLVETINVLKEMKNDFAIKYEENQSDIKKILHIRNHSILAHGIHPVTKEKINDIYKLFENLIPMKSEIKFPKIETF